MKNNEKIKDLSNIIKHARNYSLIGEYGNSLEKYQDAISIIKERQKELELLKGCEDLREKWKMTEYNIKSEMLQIKDILEKCLQLHHSKFNYSKKQLEGNEVFNENKKLMEKEIMEMYNKDKRIYDKKPDNNNKNNILPNKSNKTKNKSAKTPSINLALDSNRNRIPKMNPWSSNKNYFYNKYNKINNTVANTNDNNNYNLKKSKSTKVNMEKKMFNPLEEFYSIKPDSNSKESKINGNDFLIKQRKSELIQQKINMQKMNPFSINMKQSRDIQKDNSMKSLQNKINENKNNKIKVVQIDLDGDNHSNLKMDEKSEENIDTIEQALNNLSKFNIDNNDDSF